MNRNAFILGKLNPPPTILLRSKHFTAFQRITLQDSLWHVPKSSSSQTGVCMESAGKLLKRQLPILHSQKYCSVGVGLGRRIYFNKHPQGTLMQQLHCPQALLQEQAIREVCRDLLKMFQSPEFQPCILILKRA